MTMPADHPPSTSTSMSASIVSPARIFRALARDCRPWTLRRTLRSENPADLQGELRGKACFQQVPRARPKTEKAVKDLDDSTEDKKEEERVPPRLTARTADDMIDLLYVEEGEVPSLSAGRGASTMAGLRWSRKYVWRLTTTTTTTIMPGRSRSRSGDDGSGRRACPAPRDKDGPAETQETERRSGHDRETDGVISVWFVKPATHDEPDYLFHEMRFEPVAELSSVSSSDTEMLAQTQVPIPPDVPGRETTVLVARGEHLCVRDNYSTTYAFRVTTAAAEQDEDDDGPSAGEVVSWASRHVVKGPSKNQDILNMYSRD
ncbi:hypothetical protein VTO42DRAFT_4124 [Malbranchea cinnamomea]